eukprot:364111-Chlamydomonas_euryale.AAC.10
MSLTTLWARRCDVRRQTSAPAVRGDAERDYVVLFSAINRVPTASWEWQIMHHNDPGCLPFSTSLLLVLFWPLRPTNPSLAPHARPYKAPPHRQLDARWLHWVD